MIDEGWYFKNKYKKGSKIKLKKLEELNPADNLNVTVMNRVDTPTAKAASRIPSVSRWDSQVTNRPQSISVLDSP